MQSHGASRFAGPSRYGEDARRASSVNSRVRGQKEAICPFYIHGCSISAAYDIKKRIDLTLIRPTGSNTWTFMTRVPASCRLSRLAAGCVRPRVVVGVIRVSVAVPFVVGRQGVSG